jgi:hypothetical protein
MIREKGGYRMSLSVTGESRADCIGQLKGEFFPHRVGLEQLKEEAPRKVSLTKLEMVQLLKRFVNDKDCKDENYSLLSAKKLVEREFMW